mmetsp:Transcript_20448/g.36371  ORF Transcript_20448/g.36371 Transcript_20448/m.36371 type:complete len:310 (-) Transcript_20448:30-959(-)
MDNCVIRCGCLQLFCCRLLLCLLQTQENVRVSDEMGQDNVDCIFYFGLVLRLIFVKCVHGDLLTNTVGHVVHCSENSVWDIELFCEFSFVSSGHTHNITKLRHEADFRLCLEARPTGIEINTAIEGTKASVEKRRKHLPAKSGVHSRDIVCAVIGESAHYIPRAEKVIRNDNCSSTNVDFHRSYRAYAHDRLDVQLLQALHYGFVVDQVRRRVVARRVTSVTLYHYDFDLWRKHATADFDLAELGAHGALIVCKAGQHCALEQSTSSNQTQPHDVAIAATSDSLARHHGSPFLVSTCAAEAFTLPCVIT